MHKYKGWAAMAALMALTMVVCPVQAATPLQAALNEVALTEVALADVVMAEVVPGGGPGGIPGGGGAGLCQSSSDHIGRYQCVGKDMIPLLAGGFTAFAGNTSNYVNSNTQQVETRGPSAQLCTVTNSGGVWQVVTPFRSFTVPAVDEMVTTFNEGFRGDYAGMQSLTPLGGGENVLVYTIFISKSGSVTRTAMVTTKTKETFTCSLDPAQSTSPTPTPTDDDFVSWNNSQNGVWVVDASNESFAFQRNSGCLYSQNMKTTYTNFCIAPGSENRIRFNGQDYYILHIAARGGGCITGLGLQDMRQADIYTSAGEVENIQVLSSTWVACQR